MTNGDDDGLPIADPSDLGIDVIGGFYDEVHLRLALRDSAGRFAEPLEEVAPLVEILLAGRGRTGDDIVCADIQSGGVVRQW